MPWPPTIWDFDLLTAAAFYYHPSLDLARAQWNVTRAGIETAGARPNPTLTATPGYSSNPANGVSPWFPSVTLDVPIETAGKRTHRISRAEQLSQAAHWNIFTAAWQVRSGVRTAMLELAANAQRLDLLSRQEQIQGELATLLEQRLAVGAADITELTQYRLARQKSQVEIAAARRQAAAARARLAESVGVPIRALDRLEIQAELEPFSREPAIPDIEEARRLALQGRADVLSALAEYAAAESALHLEIAKQYPDVRFSPGYQWDQGEHKWSLGLSVELPVLNRNQGPIAESLAKREETAVRFTGLQSRVISEIDLALTNRALASQELSRAGQLLNEHQLAERLAQDRYRVGTADLVEARGAQLELAAARLALLDIQWHAAQANAQLEDSLQRTLPALPAIEQSPRNQSANTTHE